MAAAAMVVFSAYDMRTSTRSQTDRVLPYLMRDRCSDSSLLERGRYRREGRVQIRAHHPDNRDDGHRNARRDETIFDCGRGRLAFHKPGEKKRHGNLSFLDNVDSPCRIAIRPY